MKRSSFKPAAILTSLALFSCLGAGSALARDFDAPIDSLAGFTLGQTWDEVKTAPGFAPAPHLDSMTKKAGVIRKTTFLGFPVRSVMLFFKDGKLVRVHISDMQAGESELVTAMAAKYGDPRPIEKFGSRDAYIWKGKTGRIIASRRAATSTTDPKWRIVLRPHRAKP